MIRSASDQKCRFVLTFVEGMAKNTSTTQKNRGRACKSSSTIYYSICRHNTLLVTNDLLLCITTSTTSLGQSSTRLRTMSTTVTHLPCELIFMIFKELVDSFSNKSGFHDIRNLLHAFNAFMAMARDIHNRQYTRAGTYRVSERTSREAC